MQRLARVERPRRCCRRPARQVSPATWISRTRLANQGDGLCRFDNQLNSGKDGKLMLSLTDGLLKMMNFKYVFRWHLPFLFLIFLPAAPSPPTRY
jgi:hypothetical protein